MKSSDLIEELREWLADPIIEKECGSKSNFLNNVIGWTDTVNSIALKARDALKEEDK
jgi:hypothetical protein